MCISFVYIVQNNLFKNYLIDIYKITNYVRSIYIYISEKNTKVEIIIGFYVFNDRF